MPKKQSTDTRRARGAARAGVKYTTALRHPPLADVLDQVLRAGLESARGAAASLDPGDQSEAACRIRHGRDLAEAWERRRAGRPVLWWEATVEVRVAARSDHEAQQATTLAHPIHRAGPSPVLAYDAAAPDVTYVTYFGGGVAPLTDLPRDEQLRLLASFPVEALRYGLDDTDRPRVSAIFKSRYQQGLRAAMLRMAGRGPTSDPVDAGQLLELREQLGLKFWREWTQVEFLATQDEARARAEELAGTVVDALGNPAGTVVEGSLRFRPGHEPGSATHPTALRPGDSEGFHELLWEDYELAEAAAAAGVSKSATLSALHRSALHQPGDPRFTVPRLTPVEFRMAVTEAAQEEGRQWTPYRLRTMADQAQKVADALRRSDADLTGELEQVETLEQQAYVWRHMANDVEVYARLGEAAWSLWQDGTLRQRTGGGV